MPSVEAPLISVCIPAYNDAAVIGDSLRSAMRQKCAGLEILVLDNHSTDETPAVVAETAAGDSRVRYIRHAQNLGMARNFSACIAAANGEFVQILCSDDVLEDGCATALAAALCSHPQAVLAACSRTFTDQALHPWRVLRAPNCGGEAARKNLMRRCFARGNVIGEPSAVMFRRAAAVRGFNAFYSQSLDLEMWLHLLEQGAAVFVPEPLCRIRQHAEQATHGNIRSGRIVEDKRLFFRQYVTRLGGLLSPWDKLIWDGRMASSVARSQLTGGSIDALSISEVFYKSLFLHILVPWIRIRWRFRGTVASHRL